MNRGRRDTGDRAQNLGIRAAGILFIVSAVFAVLRVTVLKAWVPTEASPGQVYIVASVQALLGVALLQGSRIARIFVLGMATLGMVAVLALLAIATTQSPQLERIGFLVWMIAAAILIPPFLALLGLLVGESPSGLRVGLCVGVLALYTLGGFVLEIAAFRALERGMRAEFAQWTQTERTFADPALGLSVDLPDGWSLMRTDSPLIGEGDARVGFANAPQTALAALRMEELREGPSSAAAYLDRELEARLKPRDGFAEVSREPSTIGSAEARRLTATWRQNQQRYRGWLVAWQDGWRYYSLLGWAPEARAQTAAASFQSLERSIRFTPIVSQGLNQLLREVAATAPHLSPAAVKALLGRYPDRKLTASDAFRLGHRWSVKGLELLTPGEVQEMGQVTTVLFQGVPARDRARLGAYLERIRFDRPSTRAEDEEMARVMKVGTDKLPPESLRKLQTLLEKGIAMATTMEGSGTR
jgi:hypothetical protein